MKTVLYLLCFAVVLSGLLSSSALGQSPIGPPVASLDQGQFAAGFSYGHSKGDVKGTVLGTSVTVEDIEVNSYMVNLIFGVLENWEFQIDLGASDYDDVDLNSSGDFAFGFGVKTTFAEQDKVKWGAAVLAHWYEAGASGVDFGIPWTEDISWSEIKLAVGPSYKEARFCLYGGPFLQFIDGEGDYTVGGFSYSGDFEEDSMFGGFVGAQIDFIRDVVLGVEGQLTGSGSAVVVSILWTF